MRNASEGGEAESVRILNLPSLTNYHGPFSSHHKEAESRLGDLWLLVE